MERTVDPKRSRTPGGIWAILLGTVLCDAERYEEAITALDNELAIRPDTAIVWEIRGKAYSRLNLAEAIASYDKSLALDPDNAIVWTCRGDVHYALGRYGHFADALASYDKAIALSPGLATAWNNRGLVLFELGLYNEALDSYSRAIAIRSGKTETRTDRTNGVQKNDTKSRENLGN